MIPSGATIGGYHTLNDLGMYPKSKITFAPPAPKTNYVDVPAADGVLDYTTSLTGRIVYDRRRGSIEFLVANGTNYLQTYSSVMAKIHGKELICVLDDEPEYFYRGRFSVNSWKSKEMFSTIVLDYNLEPYKYALDTTGAYDWLWNDLFDNTIYYGSFIVTGTPKRRTLINPSATAVTPTFICSTPVRVVKYLSQYETATYFLPMGETDTPGFFLTHGETVFDFSTVDTSATGNVYIDYTLGAVL